MKMEDTHSREVILNGLKTIHIISQKKRIPHWGWWVFWLCFFFPILLLMIAYSMFMVESTVDFIYTDGYIRQYNLLQPDLDIIVNNYVDVEVIQ